MASEKKNWVDFKAIKERVSIEMVLGLYDFLEGFKRSGKNLVGCCPIHKGSNPRQFSVDPKLRVMAGVSGCLPTLTKDYALQIAKKFPQTSLGSYPMV